MRVRFSHSLPLKCRVQTTRDLKWIIRWSPGSGHFKRNQIFVFCFFLKTHPNISNSNLKRIQKQTPPEDLFQRTAEIAALCLKGKWSFLRVFFFVFFLNPPAFKFLLPDPWRKIRYKQVKIDSMAHTAVWKEKAKTYISFSRRVFFIPSFLPSNRGSA